MGLKWANPYEVHTLAPCNSLPVNLPFLSRPAPGAGLLVLGVVVPLRLPRFHFLFSLLHPYLLIFLLEINFF